MPILRIVTFNTASILHFFFENISEKSFAATAAAGKKTMEAAGNAPPQAAKKAGHEEEEEEEEEEEGKRGRSTARSGTPREGDEGSGGKEAEAETGSPNRKRGGRRREKVKTPEGRRLFRKRLSRKRLLRTRLSRLSAQAARRTGEAARPRVARRAGHAGHRARESREKGGREGGRFSVRRGARGRREDHSGPAA